MTGIVSHDKILFIPYSSGLGDEAPMTYRWYADSLEASAQEGFRGERATQLSNASVENCGQR